MYLSALSYGALTDLWGEELLSAGKEPVRGVLGMKKGPLVLIVTKALLGKGGKITTAHVERLDEGGPGLEA